MPSESDDKQGNIHISYARSSLGPARNDLKSDAVVENTVEIYSERRKFLITHPVVTRNFSVFKLSLKPATSITVTDSFQSVNNLKQCKLPLLIKSLIWNKIITPLSSITVGEYFSAGNVEKILVLETKPDCEALTVSAKIQVKIEKHHHRQVDENSRKSPNYQNGKSRWSLQRIERTGGVSPSASQSVCSTLRA